MRRYPLRYLIIWFAS
ncbi:hypothetical protein MTR67_003358 [Solanum verrucosum]|uniref:Uncharacterized protein n=1 Tax=Solanum verrucosum TaxID=315347 RepID=A0AAF0PRZ9_SOLVR|nr:hypothetical protein MTR67_003358 [Solanum verrucosum]